MTEEPEAPASLLPYEAWTAEAMREVALRALAHVAEHGLPGEHHFYLTFRTDRPDVTIPAHLRARYPQEMTVVLQHQFRDLAVDRAAGRVSVGLVFGGVPATLSIPFGALTAFYDPHVRIGFRFQPEEAASPSPPPPEPSAEAAAETPSQVVSLDAFRRKPRES
ncbi:MAG: ClpXP protease specificity-enhancing factor SspB [Acetobacteraceae bacterium]|nr:ClpXP protease specificity-enhancing factor SspB [Acetobacteraceae bacterium]MCX7685029.1 ClpXP protease specificity-enhancing factor SspB [Acetobacteraceae bacterium]MDW8398652.1 ClpXP protease specificity-enhancing factor SspB [Acetobacteraceae bacterium]